MDIDIDTLTTLLERASREAPRSPEERRAEQDVREALERHAIEQATPQDDERYEQLALFDTTPYEAGN